jgi:aryl-alcohol dehydrogenase-like predicted oxidoreductase
MSDLERRQFGRTGLSVTALGFGAMDLGGPPAANEISDVEASRVLNTVLDSGINFIDTAVCYGTSEARIGRAISHRRREFILATKCGCVPGKPMGTPHVFTAANIRAGVEHSLRTMRTEYIDIAQFHQSLTRSAWEADGAFDELLRLKQEGKIRFIGVSGTLPNLGEQIDSGVFDVFQIPYSALQREHEDIIAKARLDEVLNGMSRIEFMVRFAIAEPALDTTIVGTKNLDHLRDNVAAAQKGPLPAYLVAEAKRRLDATGSRPV